MGSMLAASPSTHRPPFPWMSLLAVLLPAHKMALWNSGVSTGDSLQSLLEEPYPITLTLYTCSCSEEPIADIEGHAPFRVSRLAYHPSGRFLGTCWSVLVNLLALSVLFSSTCCQMPHWICNPCSHGPVVLTTLGVCGISKCKRKFCIRKDTARLSMTSVSREMDPSLSQGMSSLQKLEFLFAVQCSPIIMLRCRVHGLQLHYK